MKFKTTLPASIHRFYNELPAFVKISGMLGLVIAIVPLLAMNMFLMSVTQQPPPCRPKTRIISNNENLCVHNAPTVPASHLSVTESGQRSAVIMVLSARKHFIRRKLIRETYGSIRHANNVNVLAVVFLLGNSNAPGEEEADPGQLEAEISQFGDIVVGDFVDSYRNLTRKSIMGYEWLTTFCRHADIVVKTDDDVVVNIFTLTEKLNAFSEQEATSSRIWCMVHWNENIMSNVNSKFYASLDDFPDGVFPTHCAGVGYVTPMVVIDRIAAEISKSFLGRVCTHEDVFMTGVVPLSIYSGESSDSPKNDTIELINTSYDWIIYISEDIHEDDSQILLNLLRLSANQTINLDEYPSQFQRNFQSNVFFLLLCDNMEERFLKLWQIIVNHFSK